MDEAGGSRSNRIVVIGGSAGALPALRTVCAGLPAGFAAPVLVVIHAPAGSRSVLPDILRRAGPVAAVHARDGDRALAGQIQVAPPGHDLELTDAGRLRVRAFGPGSARRSVDTLLRSAAHARGPGTIAVLLSGQLDDGTRGAIAVSRAGGTVIVQDPEDAQFGGMPANALRFDDPDLVLPAVAIAPALAQLVQEQQTDPEAADEPAGAGSPPVALAAIEPTLWAALDLFERRAAQSRKLARMAEHAGHPLAAQQFDATADAAQKHANALHRALARLVHDAPSDPGPPDVED